MIFSGYEVYIINTGQIVRYEDLFKIGSYRVGWHKMAYRNNPMFIHAKEIA